MSIRTPYTYYLSHIPTGLKYYGAKWGANADPNTFWKTYFTSSPTIKKMIELYGSDSFVPKIRKIFTTGTEQENIEQCIMWETKVIRKIVGHPNWVNRFTAKCSHEVQKKIGRKRIAQERQIHGEEGFRLLQQQRGVLAGQEALSRDAKWWEKFHSKGGQKNQEKRAKLKDELGVDPYLTPKGRAAMAKSCQETFKNTVELWHPDSTVTNKSQSGYINGHCIRCKVNSNRYYDLLNQGYITISEHMKKFNKMSKKDYQNLSPEDKLKRKQRGWDKMRKITAQQLEKIIELKKLNKSWKEISQEVGLADWYCLRHWKKSSTLPCS